jgi:sugar phosphate isomerase/epimerase
VPPQEIPFAVFTTPWPNDSIEGFADRVLELGFDGTKSPVRPGFQVAPENVERRLPELVDQFAARQLSVVSIASTLQEPVFAACAAAGVTVVRVMAPITLRNGAGTSPVAPTAWRRGRGWRRSCSAVSIAARCASQPSTRTKELLTGCAVRTGPTPGPYSRERPVSLLAGEGG